jgi:DNA repair protein RadC
MGEMAFLEQEHLRVVLLNVRNQVVGVNEVYVGNVGGAVVRSAEVLRPAVRENCFSIILVHNHPSGDPTPSADDVRVTKHLIDAAKLLDIGLLDHIILGQRRFVSLKEQKLAFE